MYQQQKVVNYSKQKFRGKHYMYQPVFCINKLMISLNIEKSFKVVGTFSNFFSKQNRIFLYQKIICFSS